MGHWVLLWLSTLASPARAASAPAATEAPRCIEVHGEARYRNYGYDHIGVLKSTCTRATTCAVSTNVNPEPTMAEVPAGATVEVLTFRGSPASMFTVRAECAYVR